MATPADTPGLPRSWGIALTWALSGIPLTLLFGLVVAERIDVRGVEFSVIVSEELCNLLAAAPNRSYLEAHGFGLDRYIADPMEIDEGLAVAPERPGHGIRFDWAALDTVCSAVLHEK
jgi:hypothetical protein